MTNKPQPPIAATRDSASAALQHDRGVACLERGQFAEAIAALRAAVALDPRLARAHFRLGMAHEAAGTRQPRSPPIAPPPPACRR